MAGLTRVPGAWSPSLAPPPGQRRFPALDGLRGIAALGVVTSHASAIDWNTTWWGPFAFTAGSTVFIFFALSGFLLYRPFVSRRSKGVSAPKVSTFARRRLLRILPAYWVALSICALWLGFPGAFGHHWWVYFGGLQIYNIYWTAGGGLPHVWTLCIELSFYVFLPIFAWLVGRAVARRAKERWLRTEVTALVALITSSFLLRIGGSFHVVDWRWFGWLPGLIDFFAVGMCFAVFTVAMDRGEIPDRWIGRLKKAVIPCWAVAFAMYVGVTLLFGPADGSGWMIPAATLKHPQPIAVGIEIGHRLMLMLLSSSLILAVLMSRQRSPAVRFLSSRPMVFCGAISYAVYLWHVPLMRWWTNQAHATGVEVLGSQTLTVISVGVPLTVLAASISYRVVELPFLSRKEPDRPAPAPTEPAPVHAPGSPPAPVPEGVPA